MIVYYFVDITETIGSLNQDKIIKLSLGKEICSCPISKFVGKLLSSEFV